MSSIDEDSDDEKIELVNCVFKVRMKINSKASANDRLTNVSTAHSRFLVLLSCQKLHSCGDERKIVINFACEQDNIYFKCRAEDLRILESDKNATFVMGQTPKSPQELAFDNAAMFFIPPEIFRNFTDVKEFIARNASIGEIHVDTFGDAHKLHFLILSFNKIKALFDKSFSNASDLQSLKLQHNQISSLSSHAFFGLRELRSLVLSFNMIAYLPLHLFGDLKSLEDLKLDNNFIKIISLGQFEKNCELTTINLEKNEIATIDADTFVELAKLERIYLNENVCVDKDFDHWRPDNQSELNCCMKPFEQVAACVNEKVKGNDDEISSHFPLIFIIFVSIFLNIFGISYFCIYKRRYNGYFPEDLELMASDANGDAIQVY